MVEEILKVSAFFIRESVFQRSENENHQLVQFQVNMVGGGEKPS